MRRITSRSPIFDKTNINLSAAENVLKNDDRRTFCTPPVFIVVVDLFCIYVVYM